MGKSKDAFRTISEVADWLDTQAHVLRFWESKFSQVKPVKRAGGRRYYRPADMLLLGGIKQLLHDDGMTIKGAQKLLREKGVKYVSGLSQPLDERSAGALSGAATPAATQEPTVTPTAPTPTPLTTAATADAGPQPATVLEFAKPDFARDDATQGPVEPGATQEVETEGQTAAPPERHGAPSLSGAESGEDTLPDFLQQVSRLAETGADDAAPADQPTSEAQSSASPLPGEDQTSAEAASRDAAPQDSLGGPLGDSQDETSLAAPSVSEPGDSHMAPATSLLSTLVKPFSIAPQHRDELRVQLARLEALQQRMRESEIA